MASANEQRSAWNRAARAWAAIYEPQRIPLFDRILDACGVTSGTHFLDAGCGGGGLSLQASLWGARVAGFDISEEMVGRAAAKIADGDFRVGDLNASPFDDGTFDVAIASECLFLSADPVGAIKELGRVCKNGGTVGVAVFGAPEEGDESRIIASAHAVLPKPPRISLLSLSADGVLEDMVRHAGLDVEDTQTLRCTFAFESFDSFWSMVRNFAGFKSMIAIAGEEQVHNATLAGAKPSINEAGELRLDNAYRLVVARV